MHNQDHKTTEVFKPASILNGADITEEAWCVSYLKNPSASEDTPEHGLMIVQSTTMLYKVNVAFRDVYRSLSVGTTKTPYSDAATLRNAFNEMVWPDANTKHTDSEILHKTWSIPKEKAEHLLGDIVYEKSNPEEPEMCGPRPNFKLYFLNALLILTSLVAIRTLSARLSSPIVGLAALVGIYCGRPEEEKPRCATWFVTKLTRLDIPEVTNSLKSEWKDKVAYVPSLPIADGLEPTGR